MYNLKFIICELNCFGSERKCFEDILKEVEMCFVHRGKFKIIGESYCRSENDYTIVLSLEGSNGIEESIKEFVFHYNRIAKCKIA